MGDEINERHIAWNKQVTFEIKLSIKQLSDLAFNNFTVNGVYIAVRLVLRPSSSLFILMTLLLLSPLPKRMIVLKMNCKPNGKFLTLDSSNLHSALQFHATTQTTPSIYHRPLSLTASLNNLVKLPPILLKLPWFPASKSFVLIHHSLFLPTYLPE